MPIIIVLAIVRTVKTIQLQSLQQWVLQHKRLHRLTMEKQLVLQQQGIQDC